MGRGEERQSPAQPATWSRGALEPVETCPACGGRERRGPPLSVVEEGQGPDRGLWRFQRCADCGSLYLDPRPDSQSLPRAYEDYLTHAPEDDGSEARGLQALVWSLVRGYLNARYACALPGPSVAAGALLRFIPPLRLKLDYHARHLYPELFPGRGRLLDVGCGNGGFLERARAMGWEAVGIEPDPGAVALCHARGSRVEQGTLHGCPQDWQGSFDVLTLRHCLEHVADPLADLRRARALLRPGGLLWLALPNPRSPGARWFAGAWRGLHPPFHLCILSGQALLDLLGRAGFTELTALRRGAHARNIIAESARNARSTQERWARVRARAAPLVRLASDLGATLRPDWGEELVLTARRPA